MGRGRQKAEQMKVARKPKYLSPDTDLNALQRELVGEDLYLAYVPANESEEDDAIDDDLYSKYADFAEMSAEEDDIDPEQLDESFWTGGSPIKQRLSHTADREPVRRLGIPETLFLTHAHARARTCHSAHPHPLARPHLLTHPHPLAYPQKGTRATRD